MVFSNVLNKVSIGIILHPSKKSQNNEFFVYGLANFRLLQTSFYEGLILTKILGYPVVWDDAKKWPKAHELDKGKK